MCGASREMIDREAEILISDPRADPAAILEPEAGLILLVYAPTMRVNK